MVIRTYIVCLFIAFICSIRPGICADAFRFDSIRRGQKQWSFVAGYGGNHRIPSAARDIFSFGVYRLRYGWFRSPRSEVGIDVTYERANTNSHPQSVTSAFSLRRYCLVRGSTALAAELCVGYTRYFQNMRSLGTKNNFTEALGFVFQRGLGRSSALTVEYCFSHTSNAGLKLPNIGINASVVAAGVSWYP